MDLTTSTINNIATRVREAARSGDPIVDERITYRVDQTMPGSGLVAHMNFNHRELFSEHVYFSTLIDDDATQLRSLVIKICEKTDEIEAGDGLFMYPPGEDGEIMLVADEDDIVKEVIAPKDGRPYTEALVKLIEAAIAKGG